MKKILFFTLGFIVLALAACNNNKSDDNSVNAATRYSYLNGSCYDSSTGTYVQPVYCTQSSQYVMMNGGCYSPATGQYVQQALCTTANNGYYMSNGACYSPQGQIVQPALCTSGVGGVTSAQCVGNYIWNSGGQMQIVSCAGANCRGYTLIEQSTGRQVLCQ